MIGGWVEMTPDLAAAHFGPVVSVFAALVVPIVASGRAMVVYAVRARRFGRQAREARRMADAEAATLDEGDTVLNGFVEYAPEQSHAMRVTLEQEGSESESSGSWTTSWNENGRRVITVAPFFVVHESGERVEPGADARLENDVVAITHRTNVKHRQRIAEIVEGDDVWVTGILRKEADAGGQGGYRGGMVWVMRPARSEPMVVSVQGPETRLNRRAVASRWLAIALALTFVVATVTQIRFYMLLAGGHTASARITSMKEISTDEGPNDCKSALVVTDTEGHTFNDEITLACTSGVAVDATFPCFAAFGAEMVVPGDGPRARVLPVIVTTIAWFVLALIGRRAGRPKRWYDGDRLNESESGRLEQA